MDVDFENVAGADLRGEWRGDNIGINFNKLPFFVRKGNFGYFAAIFAEGVLFVRIVIRNVNLA